ncbi:hypothetical protein HDU96_002411 [Phlyctochytrium bullatum]|nr:hypothetical protein HDU96_002411 [Phlyctochytrium bullatum]
MGDNFRRILRRKFRKGSLCIGEVPEESTGFDDLAMFLNFQGQAPTWTAPAVKEHWIRWYDAYKSAAEVHHNDPTEKPGISSLVLWNLCGKYDELCPFFYTILHYTRVLSYKQVVYRTPVTEGPRPVLTVDRGVSTSVKDADGDDLEGEEGDGAVVKEAIGGVSGVDEGDGAKVEDADGGESDDEEGDNAVVVEDGDNDEGDDGAVVVEDGDSATVDINGPHQPVQDTGAAQEDSDVAGDYQHPAVDPAVDLIPVSTEDIQAIEEARVDIPSRQAEDTDIPAPIEVTNLSEEEQVRNSGSENDMDFSEDQSESESSNGNSDIDMDGGGGQSGDEEGSEAEEYEDLPGPYVPVVPNSVETTANELFDDLEEAARDTLDN